MHNGTATFALLTALIFGAFSAPCAYALDRVNSASWLAFYESLADMKQGLSSEQVATLNQDLAIIDAYYLGRYMDGIDVELGDLQIRESLSGLNSRGIHTLAVEYQNEMDKLRTRNNQLKK